MFYKQASKIIIKLYTIYTLHYTIYILTKNHLDQSAVQRISQSNIKFCHQNLAYPVNYDVTDWSSVFCWNWNDHKSCIEILHNSARYKLVFALII